MLATLFGKTAAMTALTKLKAAQRAVNRDGMNLLHLAAIAGRPESTKHILENYSRVNPVQNDMVCPRARPFCIVSRPARDIHSSPLTLYKNAP